MPSREHFDKEHFKKHPMPTLGIFVKQPISGTVKTRLGAEIGNERSAELYAAFQLDLIHRFAGNDSQQVLAYAPATDEAKAFFKSVAVEGDVLWEQPTTSLGERMKQFFAEFVPTQGPVVVIGSDSPTTPASLIQQAFEMLATVDVVLGPAVDGGYYLVGQSSFDPEMFDEIDWSGPNVLHQTVQKLKASEHSLGLLTPWYDIDSLEDLRFLRGHFDAIEAAGQSEIIPQRTRQIVEEYFSEL